MKGTGVFEEGTFTLTMNEDGMLTAFIGTKKLSLITSVNVVGNSQSHPYVEMSFPKRLGNDDVDLKVEESMRVASTIPWISVKREA